MKYWFKLDLLGMAKHDTAIDFPEVVKAYFNPAQISLMPTTCRYLDTYIYVPNHNMTFNVIVYIAGTKLD